MQEGYGESIIPKPVSSQDIKALLSFTEPELMGTSRELAEKIAVRIGSAVSSETVVIGLVPLSQEEKKILAASRKFKPTILS